MKYPVRARIVDVVGKEVFPGIIGKTPEVSKPHVGKEGLAEEIENPDSPFGYDIRITLDNGEVLMGYECWWEPVK